MFYDYRCYSCDLIYEIRHEMSCNKKFKCSKCGKVMKKQIGGSIKTMTDTKPSLADFKEEDYRKKTKDKDRARRSRIRAFGHDSVGCPVSQPDLKHLVRGKVLGAEEKEIDRQEFIKAAAKSPYLVQRCQEILKRK